MILFFILVYKFLIILIKVIKKKFFVIRNLNYNISIAHVIPTLVLLFPIKSSGAIFSNLYGLMFWSLFAFSYGFLLRAKNTHKNLF